MQILIKVLRNKIQKNNGRKYQLTAMECGI